MPTLEYILYLNVQIDMYRLWPKLADWSACNNMSAKCRKLSILYTLTSVTIYEIILLETTVAFQIAFQIFNA
jgi:hypothetical protein